MDTCFDINNITFSYGKRPILKGISHRIQKGRFYGILGKNGCGKTTFLDLLVGLKPPNTGTLFFLGKDLHLFSKKALSQHLALVSQNFYINFPYKVIDVVMMGRYPHIPRFSSPSDSDYNMVESVMTSTGIDTFKDQLITELSGGERQRVIFARALAQDTNVLLLDEATSNLDINHTIALLDNVKQNVREKGLTVISVFQDLNLAAMYCDEIIFMKQGTICQTGPTEKMMDSAIIEHVFDIKADIRHEPLYQTKQAVYKTGRVQ